jgi:peptide-methionine (S)-S-oxide reductase
MMSMSAAGDAGPAVSADIRAAVLSTARTALSIAVSVVHSQDGRPRVGNAERSARRASRAIGGMPGARVTLIVRQTGSVFASEGAKVTVVTEKAILAGGCFWGMQDLIRRRPGVVSTRVGYTGGDVANATYRNHGTHAEAIEIVFDPTVTSYRDLLEFFFQVHDPTTRNRQGNDVGTSYRSAIYYTDEQQHAVADETIADVDASGLWPGKVVTEVRPAGPFWQAEPEHQDYLEHYPNGYTCHFVRPGWKLPRREDSVSR